MRLQKKERIDIDGLAVASPKRCRKWIFSVIIQDVRYDAKDPLHDLEFFWRFLIICPEMGPKN